MTAVKPRMRFVPGRWIPHAWPDGPRLRIPDRWLCYDEDDRLLNQQDGCPLPQGPTPEKAYAQWQRAKARPWWRRLFRGGR